MTTRVLAFDTASAHCAACLIDGDTVVVRVDPMAKGQAEHLMPMLEQVLSDNGLTWQDLDAIGVGTGPGNFTGIRISVSAARGLALGLDIPAVGVTHLEAQVHGLPRPVVAQVSAPRDQVYVQTFADLISTAVLVPATSDIAQAAPPIVAPETMIKNIASIARDRAANATDRPAPYYVRAADAAPPRDAAPVLLP
ncbi:tRNA (adenosine(37)-N6)-threonylcarbamoyltransferase complex dimerization subunit type 1 TsaB [Loktanella sp. F6476L]|uniref:tRNA (adenosine(37)-N6)-threonylcarbamoyltransferase complex dimerization subunit type 1 TsaB n=1 Tax=Loktanella sp. F6476L TaxID=2926405 RepID=UPI001FF49530|nr:tRNA (adenosine(37)-N6)-threonylcarbamoyltransferase complex dimerization subunit type 1 TsaB [Loktanella sp. F6476L]MCK0120199.1 tRNA (adenosine(37)-N6)-threonylcarbamoyltransferase complex dimerization subunit type 1 TsaB [Loktanella sp. F6476L]